MSTVSELLEEASKLNHLDRVELVSSLLEGLDSKPHFVSDEEARRRLDDLMTGRVQSLGEKEFWVACNRDL